MILAKNLENLGTESAFSVLAEAKALEAKGHPMIHLGLGQPDFKTPKHVVEAAKKALDDGHHGYVMSNGIPECREAVTRWIKKRYNSDIDAERILIMPGGKPTMSYAIQCFGEPGAEIIHPCLLYFCIPSISCYVLFHHAYFAVIFLPLVGHQPLN